ncbi:hypothetical protein MKQ70_17820 [Chitinophaga sedimenti]|uniref:hypothetical protein n=1 Tax=Chitinophaga sedimenti TaxID=2033606 RepID=UPI0020059BF3|nr:hypothetical protein [Chitinophaga sedimenti]MCK7556774.1 hypothetical protein [Chitinophaga sedimenti]
MKGRRYLLTILCATSLAMGGCSKLLEENAESFVSPDGFYKSENQCIAALNGCYAPLNNVFNHNLIVPLEGVTDLAWLNSAQLDAKFEISPANPGMGDDIWTACYRASCTATPPWKVFPKPRSVTTVNRH